MVNSQKCELIDKLSNHFGWTVNEAADFIERSSRAELAFVIAAVQIKSEYLAL